LGKHGVDDIMVFIPVLYSFQSSKTDRLVSDVLGVAGVYIGRGSDGVVVAALGYLFSGSQPSHYEEIPLFAALTPASALPVVPY
jgi:hypothetical protein